MTHRNYHALFLAYAGWRAANLSAQLTALEHGPNLIGGYRTTIPRPPASTYRLLP